MMELTLKDLTIMIEEMKKNNAEKLHLDISIDSCGYSVESIDFDIWTNGEFAKTVLTKKDWYAIIIIVNEREVKFMWIERTNDKNYPYMVNDSWGGKAYITSLEDLKREIRKIEKENKEKGIDK